MPRATARFARRPASGCLSGVAFRSAHGRPCPHSMRPPGAALRLVRDARSADLEPSFVENETVLTGRRGLEPPRRCGILAPGEESSGGQRASFGLCRTGGAPDCRASHDRQHRPVRGRLFRALAGSCDFAGNPLPARPLRVFRGPRPGVGLRGSECDRGKAFEVTPDGTVVWEYLNPMRAGGDLWFIATLFEPVRLPRAFPLDWLDGRATTRSMR